MIRSVELKDAKALCDIYNYYILNSIVTFEVSPLTDSEIEQRILEVTSSLPWIVFEKEKQVLGFANASEWKSRCAYKNSVEISVYLHHEQLEKGIGSRLYAELIDQLKTLGYHAIIGGISLPNEKSVALHEKFGFEKVGQFKEVGDKFGKLIDVGYWELISKKI